MILEKGGFIIEVGIFTFGPIDLQKNHSLVNSFIDNYGNQR
jgi:hypothetical protein